MSIFRTLVLTSMLTTLPLASMRAEEPASDSDSSNSVSVEIDSYVQGSIPDVEDASQLGDYRVDSEMNLYLHLPFSTDILVGGRIEESVDSLGDVELNSEFFWETIEGLAASNDLWIYFEVGKVKYIGYGADGTNIGTTISPRYLDDLLVQDQIDLRGQTGLKIGHFDKPLTNKESKALRILAEVVSGITITFFDPNSEAQPKFSSFGEMQGWAIQKVGSNVGINYQLSYVDASTDALKDKRWDVSADYCIGRVCLGAEHQDLSSSEQSEFDTQQRFSVGAMLGKNYVGGQVEKGNIKDAVASELDDEQIVSLVYKREIGNWEVAGKVGVDTVRDDTRASVYGTYRPGAKKRKKLQEARARSMKKNQSY